MPADFTLLTKAFAGELYFDDSVLHRTVRIAYSTDASVYQEMPLAVAIPQHADDIRQLIAFARRSGLTLVPRTAGTSLAGQVVSHGIIVDVSKHLNGILELNKEEKWIRVQPGVIRDDLNAWLKPHGLLFAPETSTSSRAMIGGMIGNNSCGLHSMIWGNTRNNLLEVTTLLADGSDAVFGPIDLETARQKKKNPGLEGHIYNDLLSLVENKANQATIAQGFPKPSVTRRNSGYALDHLVHQLDAGALNLAGLVAGSEGTLCVVTEAKLKLIDLPPREVGVVAVHFLSMAEALQANGMIVRMGCSASELVDHVILEQAMNNAEQAHNRFFLVDAPKAILLVEFFDETVAGLQAKCTGLIEKLRGAGLGYAYPLLTGSETKSAWDLRKAGLGLLRNLKGDVQPVNLIEDCAVAVDDLPHYIADLEALLQLHNTPYSMYAHAGDGELHVEPMVNLKTEAGRQLFKTLLAETTGLVKKYNGSLSGEHGDGRLRGNFIPAIMGEAVYELFKQVKWIFDAEGVFNVGKITATPDMLDDLRYSGEGSKPQRVDPLFDFSGEESMLRLTEKCSGSGDCRKTHITGGTMCPSYMATRNETDTTRARANVLRQYLNTDPAEFGAGQDAETVKEVLDLCLACKGCLTECPSSVDISKLRAEFLHHYHAHHGVPRRTRLIGNFSRQMKLASRLAPLYNFFVAMPFLRKQFNSIVGFHPDRSLPAVAGQTLRRWHAKRRRPADNGNTRIGLTANGNPPGRAAKTVYLFCDEFTNYNDVETGKKTILLLERLGYAVLIPEHGDSGRSLLSKGLLEEARACAQQNVDALYGVISAETPLIGIEPSAILSFRDEYKVLLRGEAQQKAQDLSKHVFLFEEWFHNEVLKGHIDATAFTTDRRRIILHGHCHQKALSDIGVANAILGLPKNFTVHTLATGCCGMAGAFGYEKEHY
ncbi:FAD-binding and (Fe-S)-binding domain-containing protein, partial [Puia sp.]|uniref:FAD-binding and (Fe-S)-binding domain-containing protein n=1 Tax=Puia sp. TaxID=2045100 RepID=UPI002F3F6625